MRTVRAAVAAFAFHALAAQAITIEPLPGSTPQTTNIGAFFPVDMGVVVRDDAGQPLAGAPVRFRIFDVVSSFVNAGDVLEMSTDSSGVAIPPLHYGLNFGSTVMEASTPGAAEPARFEGTVAGERPSAMALLSGHSQWTYVNSPFPDPVVAQVFTPNRTPLPYAAVYFYLRPDAVPSGVFANGLNWAIIKAGPDGVATAPAILANGIPGHQFGSVSALSSEVNNQDYIVGELFRYKLVE